MDHDKVIIFLFLPVFAYLLGSIPFGLILVKIFKSIDVRQIGSGNIGATNVRRAGGWGFGIATLFCDALKGAAPVYLAGLLAGDMALRNLWISAVALSAFLGHLFPLYLKFKTGGKGVATAAGCFAVLAPAALAVSLLVFILSTAASKRVSVGSLSAAAVLPLGVIWAQRSLILSGCAVAVALLVAFRHKDNIRRLMAGTEPALW